MKKNYHLIALFITCLFLWTTSLFAQNIKTSHTVRHGETLSFIANKYNTPIQKIMLWNGLNRNSRIDEGTILIVKKSMNNNDSRWGNNRNYNNNNRTQGNRNNHNNTHNKRDMRMNNTLNFQKKYRVKHGDTPESVALKFGVTVNQLIAWNHHIKSLDDVHTGTQINIAPPNQESTGKHLINDVLNELLGGALNNDDENNHDEHHNEMDNNGNNEVINYDNPTITETPITPKNPNEIIISENKVNNFISDVDENIPQTNTVNANAIAVIIGNKDYTNKDVPAVDFALRDARSMKKYLMETFGYKEGNIIYVENATQAKFYGIFGKEGNHKGQLYNYVKPNKSDVFIYYSGHGGPDPDSKEAYFVPTDCDPSVLSLNGYAIETFYENLTKIPYKSLTVVIDACFSGASENGMILKNISPVFINTKKTVLNDENAIVFTSATGEQVSSWYREQQHSLFTYYFLKGIQGEALAKDKTLSLKELKDYLNENVTYMARRLNGRTQTPETYGEEDKTIISY